MKVLKKEFIFDDPIPAPECHASTIAILNGGDAVAAWFSGEKEGADDVMIWSSYLKNGIWSKATAITTEKGIPHWNPVLFQKDDNTMYLFYKLGHKISDWKTMLMISQDGGINWSKAKELIARDSSGGRGPVKDKPIRISNGNILAPGSTERGAWKCFIDILDNQGHWSKKDIWSDDKINLIQPTLWEFPEGHIHALMRTNQGRIYRSDSDDYGENWCNAYPTNMPNNNSGIDCVMMENGMLVLVCNPVSEDFGKRSPLSVFTSSDNGITFEKQLDLETEDDEFSYPAIIADKNRIYITYTWKRKKIMYCEIEV